MGIMGFLRNRAGAVVTGAIGLAIVAFLFMDAASSGSSLWSGDKNQVGEIAGETISFEEYKAKLDQNENNFKQQMGQGNLNPQMAAYVQENTWNQTIAEIIISKEVQKLGLAVGKSELNNMVTGKNPDPQIVQSFGDPQTGELNRTQLNSFLDNIKTQDPASQMSQQWTAFLLSLKQNRLAQKYNNLVKNSIYVTSLEAREDYNQKNKLASFNYVNLEYSSIPDNDVKLTEDDYKSYYEKNKYKFNNIEENRTFEYVVFDANPSKADSADAKAEINQLLTSFKTSTNDSLFVGINSDSKLPVTYVKKGQLSPALDSLIFKVSPGTVVGPVFTNGRYEIAKVLDIKSIPDSVKSSHILINPTVEGGLDKARAKADSLKRLVQNGADFAELAKKFGTDGTKDNGGEIGFVAYNAPANSFDPSYKEAIFKGKVGDLLVVTSQFGVHLIKITDQKNFSVAAKVALVDKELTSSSKTQQDAYGKANVFLSEIGDDGSFEEQAKKSGNHKLIAENVPAAQGTIPGIEDPREILRWVYQADEGDVSEKAFETGNKYIVVKLIRILEKGPMPLDQVKKQIEAQVRNEAKAKILIEKMNKALAGAKSIEQVAQKVSRPVTPVQNVVFANPVIPGIAQENKVIGAVFGSSPNKISSAIEGERGVYVFVVSGFSKPAPLTNVFKQREQLTQALNQRVSADAFKALREKANITDKRINFF